MALEEDIANLVQAADNLIGVVDNKIQDIDQHIAVKESEVNAYLANARSEYGHICTTPNQVMAPNTLNNGVEGLNHIYMTLAVSVEAAFISGSGNSNGWPNDAAREFGDAVGLNYSNAPFNMLRVNWSGAGTGSSRFNDIWRYGKHQGSFTEAAFIKVISGTVGGEFQLMKQFQDGWGLYGRYSTARFNGGHTGLILSSTTGEMLIAMYGRVTGHADLENGNWGLFPALGN